jgi:hypothetical protein
MKKYQLSITIRKVNDQNSAASKAVLDCSNIFNKFGYDDYNLIFQEGLSGLKYYSLVFVKLFKFFLKIESGSIVGIQYPMLNNVFKIFIRAAALKKVKFFCVTHDIESLRLGGNDDALIYKETANLSYYNYIVVHNQVMLQWLQSKGITSPMHSLHVFDYLTNSPLNRNQAFKKTIVYAGNLAKSQFIYKLYQINEWKFNIYGPNYKQPVVKVRNVDWKGEYSPDEIVNRLDGDFGLIWDGTDIDQPDLVWGNYLKYNNPHKFSLYIAAGIPVIAPVESAIGQLIKENDIGLLISNLHQLNQVNVSAEMYDVMRNNCLKLREKVITGYFFSKAIEAVENSLTQ